MSEYFDKKKCPRYNSIHLWYEQTSNDILVINIEDGC